MPENFTNPYFIAFWIICGILEYGINMAYAANKYPEVYKHNYKLLVGMAIGSALCGPMTLVVSIFRGEYRYGWNWR